MLFGLVSTFSGMGEKAPVLRIEKAPITKNWCQSQGKKTVVKCEEFHVLSELLTYFASFGQKFVEKQIWLNIPGCIGPVESNILKLFGHVV